MVLANVPIVGFDTETKKIRPGNPYPELICLGASWRSPGTDQVNSGYWSNHPEELPKAKAWFQQVLESPAILAGGNVPFDLLVLARCWPDLFPLIAAKCERDEVFDIQVAERLINLSTSGDTNLKINPDFTRSKVHVAVEALARKYLGVNRGSGKASTSVRTRYEMFDGLRYGEFPAEAKDYHRDDVEDTRRIAEIQLERHHDGLPRSTWRGAFKYTLTAFWCGVTRAHGMATDYTYSQQVASKVAEIRDPANLPHLVENGYLIPAKPPKPYANGAVDKETGQPKMTKGVAESCKQGALKLHVFKVCMDHQLPIPVTEKGETFFRADVLPQERVLDYLDKKAAEDYVDEGLYKKEQPVFTPSGKHKADHSLEWFHLEFLAWCEINKLPKYACYHLASYTALAADKLREIAVATKDPIIDEYMRREEVGKLASTVLPNMLQAYSQESIDEGAFGIVNPSFEVPKASGRMASRIDKLCPSLPVHQMPGFLGHGENVIDPRQMVVARPGCIFLDEDVNALELRTTGHVTAEFFEDNPAATFPCMHARLLRDGFDLHAYLGAQILRYMGGADWKQHIESVGSDPIAHYELFRKLKTDGDDETKKVFKHFRTMAKPTGLGYIGGLGPATFVTYAAGTFGISVTVDEAKFLRDHIWHPSYPEMRPAFRHIEATHKDSETPQYPQKDGEEKKRPDSFYKYVNPWGATRVGAFYTATMNGVMMQSPGAAVFNHWFITVSRECHLADLNSVLYGSRVIIPLHDQIVLEIPAVSWEHLQACKARVDQLLVEAGARYCPRVPWVGEGGFTRVWSKAFDPVFDEGGHYMVWSPDGNHSRELQIAS